MDVHQAVGRRVVDALGVAGASELLDILQRPADARASLIGRLYVRQDARWLGELLMDLEVDEMARLNLTEALRVVLRPS
jgi:hypothetical protein